MLVDCKAVVSAIVFPRYVLKNQFCGNLGSHVHRENRSSANITSSFKYRLEFNFRQIQKANTYLYNFESSGELSLYQLIFTGISPELTHWSFTLFHIFAVIIWVLFLKVGGTIPKERERERAWQYQLLTRMKTKVIHYPNLP